MEAAGWFRNLGNWELSPYLQEIAHDPPAVRWVFLNMIEGNLGSSHQFARHLLEPRV